MLSVVMVQKRKTQIIITGRKYGKFNRSLFSMTAAKSTKE